MNPSEWTYPGQLPTEIGHVQYEADMCPGRLVRLPQVREAAVATGAYAMHQLTAVAPEPSAALLEAVIELHSSQQQREAAEAERMSAKTQTQ